MSSTEGTSTFQASGDTYDRFMGRYSAPLAQVFADFAGIDEGQRAVDVGCGPGALTTVLVDRLGSGMVSAVDPSAPFVAACAARNPGAEVLAGRAEELPLPDAVYDRALAQLVLHFVTDALATANEMRRVLKPGGTVAACVWDFAEGMQMLRHFWDAALDLDAEAPDEAKTMRFGRAGEISQLLDAAGFTAVFEGTLRVSVTYTDFDDLWNGYLGGVGPAGAYCMGLEPDHRRRLRERLFERLDRPAGAVTLWATARAARGVSPG